MDAIVNTARNRNDAWLVSVVMGLGHMRAAWPLRGLAGGSILIEGSEDVCPPSEVKVWKKIRDAYYFMSTAEKIPLAGKPIMGFLHHLEEIPSYYPRRDLSKPTWAVKYLASLVRNNGLCGTLLERLRASGAPVLHTFYATAIAADIAGLKQDHYLQICDTDFNRVWVAEDPRRSRIKYLAPCTQVKQRLLSYGVPEENIFITGFPLPVENIGSREGQETLKADLFARLQRLDPGNRFFSNHEESVHHFLGGGSLPSVGRDTFTLTFAVGGAGAQSDMAGKIIKSLRNALLSGKLRLVLSAGVQRGVYDEFMRYLNRQGLGGLVGSSVRIVFNADILKYFEEFNAALRETDVLWTKPSELSFYCALGIPILIAPTIGAHERQNRKWLQGIHAGIVPPGGPDSAGEWLFDLRDSGMLAEAAWDGFLKARKLGVYKIEELVRTGRITNGISPLEK